MHKNHNNRTGSRSINSQHGVGNRPERNMVERNRFVFPCRFDQQPIAGPDHGVPSLAQRFSRHGEKWLAQQFGWDTYADTHRYGHSDHLQELEEESHTLPQNHSQAMRVRKTFESPTN